VPFHQTLRDGGSGQNVSEICELYISDSTNSTGTSSTGCSGSSASGSSASGSSNSNSSCNGSGGSSSTSSASSASGSSIIPTNNIAIYSQPGAVLDKNYEGRTALHLAVREGNLATIQYLIKQGALVHSKDM